MIVMKLYGDAAANPLPQSGQYLKAFDFEAHGGIGEIDMTPDLDQAKRFRNLHDAIAYRATVPECKPVREDGFQNRPLTATTWEFVTVEENINE